MSEATAVIQSERLAALRPSVFVGLGGTGFETLKRLKRLNQEVYPVDLPFFEYLSIDTRDNSSSRDALDMDELCSLASSKLAKDAGSALFNLERSFPEIHKWMPDVSKWGKFSDITKIEEGANQCRALGRFILHLADREVSGAISNKVNQVVKKSPMNYLATHGLSVDNSSGVNIYIVGSLCGGTGSGQFIDVAYICRKVAANYSLKVHGIFGLPNLFQKATAGTVTDNRANAYAALQELNHFMDKGNYECHFAGRAYKFEKTPPFNSVFLVDSPNEENHALAERNEACEMIAHALFGLTASQTRKTYDEYYTNFSSSIGILVPNCKGVEFKSSFSSFGTAALVYPVKKLNSACSLWQGEKLCQQVLQSSGSLIDFGLEAEKIVTASLEPDRRAAELLGNYEKLLASWMNNGFNSLVGLKDKAIADQLESLKVDLESDVIPRLKKRLEEGKDNFFAGPEGFDTTFENALKRLINGVTEGKGPIYALSVLEQILLDLNADDEGFRKKVSNEIERLQENVSSPRFKEAYRKTLDDIKLLSKQGFIKNLFDFDKQDVLEGKCRMALATLKNMATEILKLESYFKVLDIYQKIEDAVHDKSEYLKRLKEMVHRAQEEFTSSFSSADKALFKSENVDIPVVSLPRFKEILDDLFITKKIGTLNAITAIHPVCDWPKVFADSRSLKDFILSALAPDVNHANTQQLDGQARIYSELEKSGYFEEFAMTQLFTYSAPFINIDRAVLLTGGKNTIKEMPILGVPDKDRVNEKLESLLPTQFKASLRNDFIINLVNTVHGFPAFALEGIDDYRMEMEDVRSQGDNPCYTFSDAIVAGFKHITPNADQSLDVLSRAVQLFDLGALTGFLAKKPKSGVYYYCSERNNIESGFTLAGDKGGGRLNTKAWFMAQENRGYLDRLDMEIQQYLLSISGEDFETFLKDWKTFCLKAINKGRKDKEWMSPIDGKSPDYAEGFTLPDLLAKVKDQRLPR